MLKDVRFQVSETLHNAFAEARQSRSRVFLRLGDTHLYREQQSREATRQIGLFKQD